MYGIFLGKHSANGKSKARCPYFIINQELIKITEQKNTECNKELWPIMPLKLKTYILIGTGKTWGPIYPPPIGKCVDISTSN